MNDGVFLRDRLQDAVEALACGPDKIRVRLENAYLTGLTRIRPDEDVPWFEVRRHLSGIMSELSPRGRFDVALQESAIGDLQRIALEIVKLYASVSRHVERTH